MTLKDTILIGCEVVISELGQRIEKDFPIRTIDPSLHVHPERLRRTLQEAIDQEESTYANILLGYGLCARAVEGLRSKRAKIVIPLVDDCIGLFLGARSNYLDWMKKAPGTFFLSKGWVEVGSTPFEEYEYMLKRFGKAKSERIMTIMLKHYQNLAFIHMGPNGNSRSHLSYARSKAARFGLKYQEIKGSYKLLNDMLSGNENKDLQSVRPGEAITYDMFY